MSLHSIGYLFREGLKSLWKNRTMSIASIGVLIACLLMTGVAAPPPCSRWRATTSSPCT